MNTNRQILMDNVTTIQLFRDIRRSHTQQQCQDLIDQFNYIEYIDGQTIYSIGDRGYHYYILLDGQVSVYMDRPQPIKVNEIYAVNGFGDVALFKSNCIRNQTIIASGNCLVGMIDRKQFRKIINIEEQTDVKIEMLQLLGCFDSFTYGQLKNLSYYVRQIQFSYKETVYKEGDQSDCLYMVADGIFEMIRMNNRSIQPICIVNQLFGEECFTKQDNQEPRITQESAISRYATVRCSSISGMLMRINKQDIIERYWDDTTQQQFTRILLNIQQFHLNRITTLSHSKSPKHIDNNINNNSNIKVFRKQQPQLVLPQLINVPRQIIQPVLTTGQPVLTHRSPSIYSIKHMLSRINSKQIESPKQMSIRKPTTIRHKSNVRDNKKYKPITEQSLDQIVIHDYYETPVLYRQFIPSVQIRK